MQIRSRPYPAAPVRCAAWAASTNRPGDHITYTSVINDPVALGALRAAEASNRTDDIMIAGQNALYYRYFTPQSKVVGAIRYEAAAPGMDLTAPTTQEKPDAHTNH